MEDFQRLPNVFVAGVPKAGTTSLVADLARHDDVDVSRPKEPCLFALDDPLMIPHPFFETPEAMLAELASEEGYQVLLEKRSAEAFQQHQRSCRVDGTPGYLLSDVARRRISQWVPDAKFIIILRDPTERLVSTYWHEVRHGRARDGFTEWLRYEGLHAFNSGMYYEHLAKWFAAFSPEQFLIVTSREYQQRREETLRDVFRHIGVDENAFEYKALTQERNVTPYPALFRTRLFLNKIGRKFSSTRQTTALFHGMEKSRTIRQHRDRFVFALTNRFGKLLEKSPTSKPSFSRGDEETLMHVRTLYKLRNKGLDALVHKKIEEDW